MQRSGCGSALSVISNRNMFLLSKHTHQSRLYATITKLLRVMRMEQEMPVEVYLGTHALSFVIVTRCPQFPSGPSRQNML